MEPRERFIDAYIDYVLMEGKQPPSVYAFARRLDLEEREFYNHFSSFTALEAGVWEKFFVDALNGVETGESWKTFTAREKILSLFYAFTEKLRGARSFASYSYQAASMGSEMKTPAVLSGLKKSFFVFTTRQVMNGIEAGEFADRRFLTSRYTDALWIQFIFILNFWLRDVSTGFEKTDEAIERGLQVTFDLMSRLPIENIVDYGKFILRSGTTR